MIKQYYLENPDKYVIKALIDIYENYCKIRWRRPICVSDRSFGTDTTECRAETLPWAKIIFKRYSRFEGIPIWKESEKIEETI